LAAGFAAQETVKPDGDLSVHYEELTAPDFARAVTKSGATCLIPLGILEKHGPHLPLGTDLIDCREVALRAAKQEYTIIYPAYFVGQIFEAKHQPGTSPTAPGCSIFSGDLHELARNGLKKIILVNGHGGNDAFLTSCQLQLESRKDYIVTVRRPMTSGRPGWTSPNDVDGHAGEEETSVMLAHRPELVQLARAVDESGADQKRQSGLKHAYTGIWWYAGQPNHYRGDGSAGSAEFGKALLEAETGALVEMVRSVKKDTVTAELQKRFFDDAAKPLETKPFIKK
jgi:creatinine amidohydrolase